MTIQIVSVGLLLIFAIATLGVTMPQSYSQVDDGFDVGVTIDEIVNSAPVVTSFNIPATGSFELDFYANVDDNTVDDNLIINFTYNNPADKSIATPDSSATVDADDVDTYTLVTNPVQFTLGTIPSKDTTIVLFFTATDEHDDFNSGRVDINFGVDEDTAPLIIDDISANDITYRSPLSYTQTFDAAAFTDLLNPEDNDLTTQQISSAVISFNDTVNDNHDIMDSDIDSAITFTESAGNRILQYTPKDEMVFPFTETFEFMISIGNRVGTGTISFTVIAATCGSTYMPTTPFNFGDLRIGDTSGEINFVVDNTGNADLDLSLTATDWTSVVTSNGVMLADATGVSTRAGDGNLTNEEKYNSKTQLSQNTPFDINNIVNEPNFEDQIIYLQLRATLNPGIVGFTGDIQQTITIVSSCTE